MNINFPSTIYFDQTQVNLLGERKITLSVCINKYGIFFCGLIRRHSFRVSEEQAVLQLTAALPTMAFILSKND